MKNNSPGFNEAPKKNGKMFKKVLLFSLPVVAVTALIVFALPLTSGSKPKKVATQFLNELANKDFNKAYQVTSIQFQATVPMATFNEFLKMYPILTTKGRLDFSSTTVDENIATISGNIKTDAGDESPIILHVVKEDGSWKILALSLNPEDSPREITSEK